MPDQDPFAPEHILPLLGNVRPQGDWLMTFCPAHEDGKKHAAGQNAGRKDDGRSLGYSRTRHVLKCFNGCPPADILRALRQRANVRSEMPPERTRKPVARQNEREVAHYTYRTSDGKASAEKRRYEWPDPEAPKGHGKRFTWAMPEGYAAKDFELLGSEALAEFPADVWLDFVEGEKCRDALVARQYIALCHGGGASTRDFGKAFEVLRGRYVRIWPDNDPAGAEYAQNVKREMLRAGAAKAVIMPPFGGPGQDIADAIEQGISPDTLIAGTLIEDSVDYVADDSLRVRLLTDVGEVSFLATEMSQTVRELNCGLSVAWHNPIAPRPYWQNLNWMSSSGRESLARVLAKHFADAKLNWTEVINRALALLRDALEDIDILDETAPSLDMHTVVWVLKGYMPENGGVIIHAPPKRGKSQFALAAAVAVDAGLCNDFFEAPRPRKAIYINLERSKQSMLARLARINRALGLPEDRPLAFIHARGKGLLPIMPQVRQAIRKSGAEVVFLDSISRGGFGRLNDDIVANSAVDALNSLRCTWLAIGHEPRPDKEGLGGGRLFGSVHFDAGADALIRLLSRHAGQNQLRVSIEVTDANDFGHVPPLDLLYEFDGDGLVSMRRTKDGEFAGQEGLRPASLEEEIERCLHDIGKQSTAELALALGKKRQTLIRPLGQLLKRGIVDQIDGADRRQKYYQLVSDAYSDAASYQMRPNESDPKKWNATHAPSLEERGVASYSGLQITCVGCQRSGMPLAGYGNSEEETLCPSCLDEFTGGRAYSA